MGDSVIGRLQAALTAATNEVTVAAANINFDFTLVKYEAPKEYQPLGALLSSKRKHDAENGKSHVTARRLAALFEGLCPDTPNLIRAYGDRVSHISKLATDGIAKAYTQSVFAAFTGVDATSIWAAATSTQGSKGGAIHVHLLACMLATMWDAPEAISIWSEVITGRRQQVASDLENGVALPFSMAAAAAQQDIPRSQLAEWDSSARAWIQTADNIMLKQQTQLKLILKNVDLNIPKSSGVYQSVVRTWHAALSAMENLISGIPQEVQDGVALLALSAWHIYPDIDVFGSKNVKVKMDDSLVSLGGVLSIGCNQAATTSAKGVTWALSLSHLRYYGNPVRKLAQLHDNPANLSYSEFRQAVLGCVLQIWGVRKAEEDQVLDDLYRISKPFSSRTQIDAKLRNAMSFLHEAIHDFRADRDTGCRLLDLGRKRPNFIEPKNRTEMGNVTFKQCFGLFETKSFISMLDGDEARIAYLRRIVGRYLSLEHEAIIAIRYGNIRFDSEKNRKGTNYSDDVAVSSRESSTKLDAADRDVSHGHDPSNGMNQVPFFATGLSQHLEQSTGQQQARGTHTRWYRHRVSQRKGPSGLGGQRERILLNEENKIFRPVTQTKFTRIMNGRPRPYRYLLGHLEFGAIFIPENIHSTTVSQLPDIATSVEDILWAVQFDKLCIYRHHARDLDAIQDCIMSSLAYLEEALGVFRTLPGRMIKAQILRGSIEKRHWRQYCQKTLTGAHGFRDKSEYQRTAWQMCVVSYFFAERDIHPEVIPSNAMGISAGDSIFVPNKVRMVSIVDNVAEVCNLISFIVT